MLKPVEFMRAVNCLDALRGPKSRAACERAREGGVSAIKRVRPFDAVFKAIWDPIHGSSIRNAELKWILASQSLSYLLFNASEFAKPMPRHLLSADDQALLNFMCVHGGKTKKAKKRFGFASSQACAVRLRELGCEFKDGKWRKPIEKRDKPKLADALAQVAAHQSMFANAGRTEGRLYAIGKRLDWCFYEALLLPAPKKSKRGDAVQIAAKVPPASSMQQEALAIWLSSILRGVSWDADAMEQGAAIAVHARLFQGFDFPLAELHSPLRVIRNVISSDCGRQG